MLLSDHDILKAHDEGHIDLTHGPGNGTACVD